MRTLGWVLLSVVVLGCKQRTLGGEAETATRNGFTCSVSSTEKGRITGIPGQANFAMRGSAGVALFDDRFSYTATFSGDESGVGLSSSLTIRNRSSAAVVATLPKENFGAHRGGSRASFQVAEAGRGFRGYLMRKDRDLEGPGGISIVFHDFREQGKRYVQFTHHHQEGNTVATIEVFGACN